VHDQNRRDAGLGLGYANDALKAWPKKIAPEGAIGVSQVQTERGRLRLDSQILWLRLYPGGAPGVIHDTNSGFAYLVDNAAR
jgi:hypothetical protein